MRFRWTTVQTLMAALKPAWLAAVIVVAISGALHHPQTIDVLVGIREDAGLLSGKHFLLLASVLTLAFCGWYFPRALLYVRYWNTPPDSPGLERWRRWSPRGRRSCCASIGSRWTRADRPARPVARPCRRAAGRAGKKERFVIVFRGFRARFL